VKLLQRTIGAANRVLYRAAGGRVGGRMKGAPILLLTTKGRKSGKKRVMPLLYLRDNGNVVVVASSGGTPTSPAWFHNLKASPDVEIEIGRERESRRARVASSEERARLWPRLVEMYSPYAEYQKKTTREIPVVVLEPRS
jgi:F420H(2)-dependent quinone reductase